MNPPAIGGIRVVGSWLGYLGRFDTTASIWERSTDDKRQGEVSLKPQKHLLVCGVLIIVGFMLCRYFAYAMEALRAGSGFRFVVLSGALLVLSLIGLLVARLDDSVVASATGALAAAATLGAAGGVFLDHFGMSFYRIVAAVSMAAVVFIVATYVKPEYVEKHFLVVGGAALCVMLGFGLWLLPFAPAATTYVSWGILLVLFVATTYNQLRIHEEERLRTSNTAADLAAVFFMDWVNPAGIIKFILEYRLGLAAGMQEDETTT